jgi:HSP20 family protein
MNLVVRDPFWREFTSLSNRLNRLLDSPRGTEDEGDSLGNWTPAVDIYDKGTEVVIHAEVPGLKKEDIDIRVENNILTIRGKKERKEEVKEEGYFRSERSYGSFTRSFSLPNTVEVSKIAADYKDGVLSLRLPKAEEAKPRQIEVKIS